MRESPSLLRSAFAMLLLFILFAMTTCTALAQPVASPRPFGMWATGGGGTLRGDDGSAWGDVIGLHVQRGAMVVSMRRHSGALDRIPTEAISLLVGRASESHGPIGAAISAGISRVRQRGYFDNQHGVERSALGAMLVGDVSLRKGDAGGVGMGLTMFANTNGQRSFAGVQVELVAGRWR